MVKLAIRCGNSNAVYNAAVVSKDEAAPRRVTTPIHLAASKPVTRGFRVLARLRDGTVTLVALAETRAEAVTVARQRARELPPHTARLEVEKWEGGVVIGHWVTVATRPGELPVLARPTGSRPLGRRAARLIEQGQG